MDAYINRRTLIIIVVIWLVVLGVDELTYFLWKKYNPGSNWQGLFINPHPLSGPAYSQSGGTPNGSARTG